MSHKNFKNSSCKVMLFPKCVVLLVQLACFNECFLFYVITGRHYFFYKSKFKQRFLATRHVVAFCVKSVLREVFYLRYTAKNTVISPNFWCRNFVERNSFRIVSGDSPETMRKLCLSTKFPHQEIR